MLGRMTHAYVGRLAVAAALLVGGAFAWAPARAADPQPYTVTMNGSGTGPLDAALRDGSLLSTLQSRAPAPPFGLVARARGDIARLTTVLHSFGFYQGSVTVTIAGYGLDDPALLPALDATPEGRAVPVVIAIDRGDLYHLRKVTIEGMVPAEAQSALQLASGAPANAADVVAAQARLLAALQEAGYAIAEVPDPTVYADDAAHVLDVTYHAVAGPKVEIGKISFEGLSGVNEEFVSEALTVHTGDSYKPSAIESARQALVATGVFTAVNVRAGELAMEGNRIPLTFTFQERPAHAVGLSGTYSTDLGIGLSASWSHRNLFGNAEQLNLTAAGTGLGGNATGSVGYRFGAQYIKPMFLRMNQTLQFDASVQRQDLLAYDQNAYNAGVTLRRPLFGQWKGSAGIGFMQDEVVQEGTDRIYQLLSFPLTATYDSTGIGDPLADPLHGIRASFAVTPTESFGARNNTFFVFQALASTYVDLSQDGRSVLALRGLAGSVIGASNFDLPPDQRLYAGGSATVRGFPYQSIGPLFSDGNPIGGTAVDAGTAEFRQRLWRDYGAVAFIDAGQASAEGVPFTGDWRVGAGVGARYYTSIGGVRVDIAFPITAVPNQDSFQLYIGLGQAF